MDKQEELVFYYDATMSVNTMYWTNYKHKGMKFLTRPAKLLKAKVIDDTLKQMNGKKIRRSEIQEVEIKLDNK